MGELAHQVPSARTCAVTNREGRRSSFQSLPGLLENRAMPISRVNTALSHENGRFGVEEVGLPLPRRVRAILVDHEPLAREWLRRSLDQDRGVEIVAECQDGEEAVREIARRAPDLVFLEVELAGLDGFEVMASCAGSARRPEFVFVTAEEKHALRAFEAAVLDYILKPVDGERVLAAVRRARRLRAERVPEGVREALPELLAARRKGD